MDKIFSLHMDKMRSTLKILSNEQVGIIIRALFEYQDTGENNKISEEQIIGYAYEILQQSLIYLNEKRTGFSEAQKNRVKRRWEKEKEKEKKVRKKTRTGEYPGKENDTPAYPGMPDEAEKLYRGISGNTENTNTVTVTATVTETATATETAKVKAKALSEALPLNSEKSPVSHAPKKTKKLPLRERELENDYEKVEKVYYQNWELLFSQKRLETKDPIVNYTQTRKLLKTHFQKLSPDLIIKAVNNGMADNFVMQGGYSLGTILSAGVLNRLINATDVKTTKHRLASDYVPPEKVSEYFNRNKKSK